MIIGDPSVFAIESSISEAYERISLRGLGLFVIHVGGCRYGVYESDATMLACSFDAVGRRIGNRGAHAVPFATESDAGAIADAFREAIYSEQQKEQYFGIDLPEFCKLIYSRNIVWAPDGDEAFDDGSYVLQFDVQDRVRLIAFQRGPDGRHDPATIRDLWITADNYYAVLQRWQEDFKLEWATMPKVHDGNDG